VSLNLKTTVVVCLNDMRKALPVTLEGLFMLLKNKAVN